MLKRRVPQTRTFHLSVDFRDEVVLIDGFALCCRCGKRISGRYERGANVNCFAIELRTANDKNRLVQGVADWLARNRRAVEQGCQVRQRGVPAIDFVPIWLFS
jgi:hypothetical protein